MPIFEADKRTNHAAILSLKINSNCRFVLFIDFTSIRIAWIEGF